VARVTGLERILALHDVDAMRDELADVRAVARLRKLGFAFPAAQDLDRVRERLAGEVDHRWLHHYERAHARYKRALTAVRARVCQGCFITLPTSTNPADGEPLTTCESCGRILYWR
jgi:predicted  nucleic acid-binding Zn-ribbon protein